MTITGKQILIISKSVIQSDPRVRRQISWLCEEGAQLHVVGLGGFQKHDQLTFIQLTQPPLLARLAAYLFFTFQGRSNFLLGSAELSSVIEKTASGFFDLVILNDLDFAGHEELFAAISSSQTPLIWDLHEYFPDLGGGLFWKLTQARYHAWLFERLKVRNVVTFSSVSEPIVNLYRNCLSGDFFVLTNAPSQNLEISSAVRRGSGNAVRLLYHGAIGRGRGLPRLIRAMTFTEARVTLDILAVGHKVQILFLKLLTALLGLRGRVKFHPPVGFQSIIPTISKFDCEVIFYHPPHSTNERLSLPNKFFESMSAGLGIVVGESPSMSDIVLREGNGIVVKDWSARSLARAVNSLGDGDLIEMRRNSLEAFSRYSGDKMRLVFVSEVSRALARGAEG